MATMADANPKRLSLSELDAVLEQARAEGWRALALIGPSAGGRARSDVVPEAQTFCLSEPLARQTSKLSSLTGLTSIDLRRNKISAEDVQALATLGGLTT